ncbi:insulin-like growth factor binding proteinn-terminal [Anaeramoeba flamelloides]|uniref:Insulin-like growth factor binding proteinn-terminal n=1 Tax=Anaeramoeba flamelloides TaxID=1746091 RepID=A0AAV7ZWI0_9EUKA|nr:insulin-like growth factor binding proteinn-terminal [Anaeramoeba flamelloides]
MKEIELVFIFIIVTVFVTKGVMCNDEGEGCLKRNLPEKEEHKFQVNPFERLGQQPQVVTSIDTGDSKFVVCWPSTNKSADYDIFCQMYSSTEGNKIGDVFKVDSKENQDHQNPTISSAGTNKDKFVVCWQTKHKTEDEWGIFCEIFSSYDGTTKVNSFQVNTDISSQQENPFVESIGFEDSQFVVCWQKVETEDSGFGIVCKFYSSSNGAQIAEEFPVGSKKKRDETNPSIASIAEIDASEVRFVVCWQSDGYDGSGWGILCQIYSRDNGSNSIGDEFRVNSEIDGHQKSPTVSSIGPTKDKFVVCWQSDKQDGNGWGIFCQIYTSTIKQSSIGSEFRVNNYTSGSQENPSLVSINDPNGVKFMVSWQSQRPNQAGGASEVTGIYTQIYNCSDVQNIHPIFDQEFQIDNDETMDKFTPDLAFIDDPNEKKFIITWQSRDPENNDYRVYTQIYKSTLLCNCEKGSYSNYSNPNKCLECSAGSYQKETGQTICEQCLIGTYQNETKQSLCFECSPGTFQNQTGQTFYYECLTGSYQKERAKTQCDQCLVGRYQPETKQSFCYRCSPGTFQNQTGQTFYYECLTGSYQQNWGKTQCDQCEVGRYQPETKQSFCYQCSPGTYQEATGQTFCRECVEGNYQDKTGQPFCERCSKGTYQNATGKSLCDECLAGTYQDQTKQTNCKICSNGTYQNEDGKILCPLCPPGNYQNNTGQTDCFGCPKGSYTEKKGSKTLDDCQSCDIGTYGDAKGLSSCKLCDVGSYTNVSGSTKCHACPPGTYAKKPGSIECKSCEIGTFQNDEGQPRCVECPMGTYQNTTGKADCFGCPEGSYNQKKGSTSLDDCQSCDLGSYGDTKGSSSCIECDAGTYMDHKGSSICKLCDFGMFSPDSGSTGCRYCSQGDYQDTLGAINCKSCGFNQYQPDLGSKECNYCPLFSETLSTQTKTIQECFCKVGYYGKPGEVCQTCPKEGICDTFNQHYPKPQDGYWQSKDYPDELHKCIIPSACPGREAEACNTESGYTGYKCTKCLQNFYQSDLQCEQCPGNANQRLALILIVIFLILLVLLFLAQKATSYFGSFTINFSFLQILILIHELDIDWPTNINGAFQLFKPFNFDLDFLATECSFDFSYFEKWLIIQLLPVIFLFLLLIIYFILFLHSLLIRRFNLRQNRIINACPSFICKPSKSVDNKFMYYLKLCNYTLFSPFFNAFSNQELKNIYSSFVNVYLTLLTLLYLILSQKCLETFNCQYNNKNKKFEFLHDTDNNCFEGFWLQKMLPLTIIFIVLYIIGIPILILYLLIKNSKILTEKQFDMKFGLLYSRYNKSFFYWEIVIMLRKLLLIILKIFLFDQIKNLNIIFFIIILLIAMILQFKYKPYHENRHNILESFLLTVSICILFFGLIFNSSEVDVTNNESLSLINVLMLMLIISILFMVICTIFDVFTKIKKKETTNVNLVKKENKIINLIQKHEISFPLLLKWHTSLSKSKLKKLNKIFFIISKFPVDNNKKMMQSKNATQSLLKHLFKNDLIMKFVKWYHKKATLIQKIKINKFLSDFVTYYFNNRMQNSKNK